MHVKYSYDRRLHPACKLSPASNNLIVNPKIHTI